MIPNKEKEGWNYLAIRKLSAFLHRIAPKHKSDFYCLNCLHSFRTEERLKAREKLCKNVILLLIKFNWCIKNVMK